MCPAGPAETISCSSFMVDRTRYFYYFRRAILRANYSALHSVQCHLILFSITTQYFSIQLKTVHLMFNGLQYCGVLSSATLDAIQYSIHFNIVRYRLVFLNISNRHRSLPPVIKYYSKLRGTAQYCSILFCSILCDMFRTIRLIN